MCVNERERETERETQSENQSERERERQSERENVCVSACVCVCLRVCVCVCACVCVVETESRCVVCPTRRKHTHIETENKQKICPRRRTQEQKGNNLLIACETNKSYGNKHDNIQVRVKRTHGCSRSNKQVTVEHKNTQNENHRCRRA